MRTLFIILASSMIITGCSIFNPHGTWGERGQFWCNERYRESKNWGEPERNASLKGYMYALSAALALQSDDPRDLEARAHHFAIPRRLEVVDKPDRLRSGFEVITFRLKPLVAGEREEIIIAFAGSNDRSDWITTNLNPFGKKQYDEAVEYTQNIIASGVAKNRRLVVAGISLGGGLAIHVLKNEALEPYIDEAWAINPSPKIYASLPATAAMKSKTWLVYSDREILTWGRGPLRHFIRGGGSIEPGPGQTAVFKLLSSNRTYAHFRWGIARQMLWVADYELSLGKENEWTEPLAILADSEFRSCLSERSKYGIKKALQPVGGRPDYSGH
ncbi:hypothetical protein [Stutzerimonas stutzeri]|uniref:hypothetical protein n=1 Tax=Stutzerimonas stutzeri TaxID=316 RepID=UPI00177E3CA9|nr:hypothetical protein [Stutzerimonas stutzeri]MBD9412132.1 hypothetical protein [Stutzerimonas stutzeri]